MLWLVDGRGQPFVLPMSHAGLRARSLALAGAPNLARSTAEQGTPCGGHPLPSMTTIALIRLIDG